MASRPSAGEVVLRGVRLQTGDPEWHRRIGVLSHQSFLYGHLTLEENLRFFGRLFGFRDLSARIPERLEQVGLAERANSQARTLSRGMRQRLALARTLLHDPDFVLLDEPYTGLDAHAAAVLRQVLASLKDGHRTVILVTHNLSQGARVGGPCRHPGAGALRVPGGPIGDRCGRLRALLPGEGGGGRLMEYLRQMGAVIWKDLVVELRTRERIAAMGGFTVLVGVLFNYSIDPTVVEPQAIAAGLIWMTMVFGGMLGLGRTFHLEEEDGAFQGILLSPIPRDALYLGKVVANFILLAVVTALVFGVFALFFGLRLGEHPARPGGGSAPGDSGLRGHRDALQRHFGRDQHGGDSPSHPGLSPSDPLGHLRCDGHRPLFQGLPVSEVDGNVRMLGAFAVVALAAGAGLFRFVVEE